MFAAHAADFSLFLTAMVATAMMGDDMRYINKISNWTL